MNKDLLQQLKIFEGAMAPLDPPVSRSLPKNQQRGRKGACMETRIPLSIQVHDLLAFEIRILLLKLTVALNLNFSAK